MVDVRLAQMRGQVIAIASGKGGVGKTATTVNLAISFRLQDRSVALVDGDIGMPNLAAWFDIEPTETLHDVLAERIEVSTAVRNEADGFGILAGSNQLADYSAADPSQFAYVTDRLSHEYKVVLIDTGGGLSYENSLPLQLADHVLLVTSPAPPAVADTKRTKALVEMVEGSVLGVIVTKVTDDTNPQAIASDIGVELLGSIPFDQTVDESITAGQPLEMYDAESPAARAYREIGETLVEAGQSVTRATGSPPSD